MTPSIVALPNPEGHDLNKLEFTLPEDSSTQVTAFLAKWGFRRFFKIFLYIHVYPYIKI